MVEIATERLLLRPFQADDLEVFVLHRVFAAVYAMLSGAWREQ